MTDNDGIMTMNVTINGTAANPWRRYGLRCNPLPQLGVAEFTAAERAIASLDGDPVTGPADIAARLAGFTPEFIALCAAQWRPGQRVRFAIRFPRARQEAESDVKNRPLGRRGDAP